jgi:hypothetical protein
MELTALQAQLVHKVQQEPPAIPVRKDFKV